MYGKSKPAMPRKMMGQKMPKGMPPKGMPPKGMGKGMPKGKGGKKGT